MALTVGQCAVDPVTGACGRVWSQLLADPNVGFLQSAFESGSIPREQVAAFVRCIVQGVFEEIAADGVVTIPASSMEPGVPPDDVHLSGAIS